MTHTLRLALALFGAGAALSMAQAETSSTASPSSPRMYAEIGYTAAKYKESFDVYSFKSSPGAVTGSFGFQVHPNIAVETFFGMGMGKDKVKFEGQDTGFKLKLGNMVGVFARPSVDIGDTVQLFGRLGWVNSQVKVAGLGVEVSARETSMAYGFGANFNLSKTSYLQASWTQFYDKKETKIDGLTLAYGMRF